MKLTTAVACILLCALILVAAIGAQVEAQSHGQALHVFVGKSVVISMQAAVTRALSSNPGVIDTFATTPTQIVVEGRAPGQSSLILWDNAGHSQIIDVIVAAMPRRLKLSPLQRNILVMLEESRAETVGTVLATLNRSREAFTPQVEELVSLGLIRKDADNLVLTERGKIALTT